MGSPGGSVVTNLSAKAGDPRDAGLFPGFGRSPGGRNDNPLQDSCLENSTSREAWLGYSLWGHRGLDMTEGLSTHNKWEIA